MSDSSRVPSFPWGWYIALVSSAGATGVAFAFSKPAGLVLVGATVIVYVAFMTWAVRRGRRLRAAGHAPGPRALEQRLRRRARWLTVLALATGAAAATSLAMGGGHDGTPGWLIMAPPVLLLVGVAVLWLLETHLRRQADIVDQAS